MSHQQEVWQLPEGQRTRTSASYTTAPDRRERQRLSEFGISYRSCVFAAVFGTITKSDGEPLNPLALSVGQRRRLRSWRVRSLSEIHQVPREPRNPLFKKPDLSKLIELAKKKGLPNYSIEIRHDGLTLIVGEAAKAPADGNDLDNWMAKHHADQA